MTRIGHDGRAMPYQAGIGLRAPHIDAVIATRPPIGWVEVHSENYMVGGPARRRLEAVRRDLPVALHGVGLSLGSAGGLDPVHLERVAALVGAIEPALVSEHLAWSRAGRTYLNDLLPVPYTPESLAAVAENIGRLQDRLRRTVLIENPSRYLRFADDTLSEPEFLAALVTRTGCGVLLDVNNVHVSTFNLGGNPYTYFEVLPRAAVGEIHLAGHSINDADGQPILIDDHGSPVADAVWMLFDAAVRRFPDAAVLVEWDSDIPPLETLVAEAAKADARRASQPEVTDRARAS